MSADPQIVSLPSPSHSIEAEQSVLGGLLLDNQTLVHIFDILKDADFYRDDHRRIFRHITKLIENGQPADLVTVFESIEQSEDKDKTGGLAYLGSLAQNTPSAHNIRRYAEIVRERAQRREIAAIGIELQDRAGAPGSDVLVLRREAEKRLSTIMPVRHNGVALDWPDLATREPPPRRWAIRGWLGHGHVTLLVGPGGIGKTLVAQQAASCLALGRAFIDEIPAPLPSLMWCCEDDANELWRRQVAIARWLDVPLDAFEESLILEPRAGLNNALVTSEYGRLTFTPQLDELRQQAGDYRAQVVILDNAAQLYGANENDRHAVTVFLNALVGVLPGRAILLLAHPSRGNGSEFSGSSAWENCSRTRLYLGDKLPDAKADEDGGGEAADDAVRYLARRKANYSIKDYRRFTFDDGVLIPDVIEAGDGGGIMSHLRDERTDRLVIEGMQKLAGMGLRMTEGGNSPQFLPRLLLEYKLAEGRGKGELAAAMRRLMMAEKIKACR